MQKLNFCTTFRKHKGLSLVETLIAVLLFSMAMMIMARLTAVKVDETYNLDNQYSLLNADAMMSDMYRDFHNCSELTISTDETSGKCSVAFNLGEEGLSFYEYVPETGYFYKNGLQQFKANSFRVTGNLENITIALKLVNEKLLEMDIYR